MQLYIQHLYIYTLFQDPRCVVSRWSATFHWHSRLQTVVWDWRPWWGKVNLLGNWKLWQKLHFFLIKFSLFLKEKCIWKFIAESAFFLLIIIFLWLMARCCFYCFLYPWCGTKLIIFVVVVVCSTGATFFVLLDYLFFFLLGIIFSGIIRVAFKWDWMFVFVHFVLFFFLWWQN